jgi:chorismate synthase
VSTGAPIALQNPEQGLGELAAHDARGSDDARGRDGADRPDVTRPRPGHADLAGFVKYGHDDIRNVLERASARETAARVAVGAIARQLLQVVGVEIVSHVTGIGSAVVTDALAIRFDQARAISSESPLHCVDADIERQMIAEIDRARDAGDTMGGSFEVIAHAVPPGLGSHVQWDRKLDGRLAQALMSIPAIKAVGIGRGPRSPPCQDRRFTTRSFPVTPRRLFRCDGRPTTPAASKAA